MSAQTEMILSPDNSTNADVPLMDVGAGDLLAEGARYHAPASTYKKLFGGLGHKPEQNLRVISSSDGLVTFNHDGKIETMTRAVFLRLARKTIDVGNRFFPANAEMTDANRTERE